MKTPTISVLMALYNEPIPQVRTAIRSILEQTVRDFEFIIVIDDPHNAVLVRELRRQAKADKRIVLIYNEKNMGLAASLNAGLAVARGTYIARMDGDDKSVTDRFKKQLAWMKSHPNVDFLFAWTTLWNVDDSIIGPFSPARADTRTLYRSFFTKQLFAHPTLFAKASTLKKHQYDSAFRRSQDFELWLRTLSTCTFDILEESLLFYRITPEDIPQRIRKQRTFSSWGMKALRKNKRLFIGNPFFWLFTIKTAMIALVSKLPDAFLHKLLAVKDGFRKA